MPVPQPLTIDDLPGDLARQFEGCDHGSTVSFYVGRFPPGTGPPLHRHPYEETFIVQEGSAMFTIDGHALEVGAGQIVVVPAAAAHRFVATGVTDLRQVSVHPRDRMVQEDIGS